MTWPFAPDLQAAVEQAEARYLKRSTAIRASYYSQESEKRLLDEAMEDIETDIAFWHIWDACNKWNNK